MYRNHSKKVEMAEDKILVAVHNRIAHIRVSGKASLHFSEAMRHLCIKLLEMDITMVSIDLSACKSIDSSFMGILAMLGLRGREKQLQINLANVQPSVNQPLTELGLRKLFVFSSTEHGKMVENYTSLKKNTANLSVESKLKTMIDAHETLMDIDSSNIAKFKDVVEFLRQDLKQYNRKNS